MNVSFYRFILTILFCSVFSLAKGPADAILVNGRVFVMDAKQPYAEALAIRAGKVVALGSEAEIRALAGPETRVIDMRKGLAVPGLIDGHAHLKGIGLARMRLRLGEARNWDEIVAMVRKAAAEAEPGTWILGRGWHQEKWDREPTGHVNGYPRHQSLSDASPNHPVLLSHASGHAIYANARAMSLAGITKTTPDPHGGRIIRDAEGQPIGVFEETAEYLIQEARSRTEKANPAQDRKALMLGVEECLSKGITTIHDAGTSFETIDLLKDMVDKDQLHMRVWVMALARNEVLREKLPSYRLKDYGGMLTVGGIKRYMDGALGSRGAWLLKPYHDLPSSSGQSVTTLDSVRETARIALENNVQLCVHAIGDRGNRAVLDLYAEVLKGQPKRWRIEHAQHVDPQDIPRFAELGVIASMQGIHCTSDAPFVVKRLGEERARQGAYVWKSLIDSGAIVTNGTDAPVEDVDPIANLYAMVTRQPKKGAPFFPKQRLDMAMALRCYTYNNAYAAFEESFKGRLTPGMLADITVLSQDVTRVAQEELLKTTVLTTIVGGKVAWQQP